MAAEGPGILETSPRTIALVMVFFLVVTLGFERLLHYLKAYLRRHKRLGLLAAVDNMANELMLLGLASLLLMAFQQYIVTICVPAGYHATPWLAHVDDCACCLAYTKGVSECFLQDRQCTADSNGVCLLDNGALMEATNSSSGRRLLQTDAGQLAAAPPAPAEPPASTEPLHVHEAVCRGPFPAVWPECDYRPGYAPAAPPEMLHQVHLFLFIIAAVHVVVGLLALLFASLRLRSWEWMAGKDDALMQQARHAAAAKGLVPMHSTVIELAKQSGRASGPAAQTDDVNAGHTDQDAVLPTHGDQQKAELAPGPAALGWHSAPSTTPDSNGRLVTYLQAMAWSGRPERLQGLMQWAREACAVLLRQFVPWTVTRMEYQIIRASFFLTHGIADDSFQFGRYLAESMELDGARVVGLGLFIWAFIIVFVLLSGAIGWCIWVFTIIAGVLLFLVNVLLISTARYATRGGYIRRLQWGRLSWLMRSGLLLHVIKLLLFFTSFVVSNSVYFASQFGPHSCFFSRTGFQGAQPIHYYGILAINIVLMLSITLVTLPLYALVVHTTTLNTCALASSNPGTMAALGMPQADGVQCEESA